MIWSEVGGGGGGNGVVVSCGDNNENEPKVSASTRKETNAQNDFEKGFEVDIFIGLHNSENQMFEGSVKIYYYIFFPCFVLKPGRPNKFTQIEE